MFGCLLSSHTGTPHTHFRVPMPLNSHGHQLVSKSLTSTTTNIAPAFFSQCIQKVVFHSSISSVTVTICVVNFCTFSLKHFTHPQSIKVHNFIYTNPHLPQPIQEQETITVILVNFCTLHHANYISSLPPTSFSQFTN